MNNKMRSIFVLTVLVLCSASCLEAGSIWAKRDKSMKDIYADDKARYIGDILTVLIVEDSTLENKSKRNNSKTTDRSIDFDGGIGADFLSSITGFGIDAKSTNTLGTKADYKDERSFVDSITVVIIDIMPNNNLIVMGTRDRDIAGDTQVIEVSGIVRPSDIGFDNTIESKRMVNFRIVTTNKGIGAAFNRPGWLGRIMDILWPF